jgi:hypothetical protein
MAERLCDTKMTAAMPRPAHSPLRYRRDREQKLALQKSRLIFQSRGVPGSGPFQKTHQRPSYGLVFSRRSQKTRCGPTASRSLATALCSGPAGNILR